MSERCLTFDCYGETLVGILHQPDVPQRGIGVLVIVGGPQYRVGSHRQFVLMARDLAAAGFPVFRFDYRGMGDSTGQLRSFESVEDDIAAAVDAMIVELSALRKIVLFGLCDAASAALMYPVVDSRVVGLILANPWVRTEAGRAKAYMRHYYGHRLLQRTFWKKLVSGRVSLRESYSDLRLSLHRALTAAQRRQHGAAVPQFIERMLMGTADRNRPILLLMSGRDLTAREFDDLCKTSPEWAKQISAATIRRVDLIHADHTFSNTGSQREASRAALGWLGEFDR